MNTQQSNSLSQVSSMLDMYLLRRESKEGEAQEKPNESEPSRIDARTSASTSPPSALTTARAIEDIDRIHYPDGIKRPKPELNANAQSGKFRYDRDFMLQFMSICKERPENMTRLNAIGLAPDQLGSGPMRGQSARRVPPLSKQLSQFAAMPTSKLSSHDRSAVSMIGQGTASSTSSSRSPPVAAQEKSNRTRSKRMKNTKSIETTGDAVVAPLQSLANRWVSRSVHRTAEEGGPGLVDHKVKALLNKITMDNFGSISDQIIGWANKSEKEADGRTMIQVIRLILEHLTYETALAEVYACLCRKMTGQISSKVQDESIRNNEGKPITGGQLFRKYLLIRCEGGFEQGWGAKEREVAVFNQGEPKPEIGLFFEEYLGAQKAKRQGLGIVKFMGELFKLQMLTERIIHKSIRKLLANIEIPEVWELETLCTLMSTVGQLLDTPRARQYMDVYFARIKVCSKYPKVSPRLQFMLQDIIELRQRNWISRNQSATPTTLAQVHEAAAKEKAVAKGEPTRREIRGGSRRGQERDRAPSADGRAATKPVEAGDLSSFGKISKGGSPPTFGQSSVFTKISPTASNSNMNMFSLLCQRPDITASGALTFMSAEEATKNITEDLKEFFAIRNLDEAEYYFTKLPTEHRFRLVDALVSKAIEAKVADAKLVASLFLRSLEKGLCSPMAFEEGFMPTVGILDDIAIDVPKALDMMAIMMKGAGLDRGVERQSRIVGKSMNGDMLRSLLS